MLPLKRRRDLLVLNMLATAYPDVVESHEFTRWSLLASLQRCQAEGWIEIIHSPDAYRITPAGKREYLAHRNDR